MQLRCSSGHSWDYLPNFPSTEPCPECGQKGTTDFTALGKGPVMVGPINYDLALSDPIELQFWQENQKDMEDKHLSGDRYTERYDFIEKGPKELRPFGGDDQKRKEAERTRGYSPHGPKGY